MDPQRAGELTERRVILSHLTNGLIMALASAQPACYNRHRWTGSDIAVDHLAVFEAVHRLLSTTYARFCASFRTGAPAARLLQLAAGLAAYDDGQGAMEALDLEPEAGPGPAAPAGPADLLPGPEPEAAEPAAAAGAAGPGGTKALGAGPGDQRPGRPGGLPTRE